MAATSPSTIPFVAPEPEPYYESWFTVSELVDYLGETRKVIERAISRGQLRAEVHAGRRGPEYLISPQAVIEWTDHRLGWWRQKRPGMYPFMSKKLRAQNAKVKDYMTRRRKGLAREKFEANMAMSEEWSEE
jgi:hypothetical protein